MTETPAEVWRKVQERHDLHDIELVDGCVYVTPEQEQRLSAAAVTHRHLNSIPGVVEVDLAEDYLTVSVKVVDPS